MSRADTREADFGRLAHAHAAAIRRLAAAYERDPARREDLEQDIWTAVWQALPAFRHECSERTFLFRIAHNRAVSHIQRQLQHKATGSVTEVTVIDAGVGPEEAAARAEQRARLHAATCQLPLSLRQPVVLMLEGLTHREIGEVLGISETNVAVRLTRARSALRALLGGKEPGS